MSNSTLQSFDFVTVMVYSNLSDCQSALAYFSSLGEPSGQMTLGVPFFGQNASGSISETYATILAAYPDAWQSDQVSGGALDGGVTLYYVAKRRWPWRRSWARSTAASRSGNFRRMRSPLTRSST